MTFHPLAILRAFVYLYLPTLDNKPRSDPLLLGPYLIIVRTLLLLSDSRCPYSLGGFFFHSPLLPMYVCLPPCASPPL